MINLFISLKAMVEVQNIGITWFNQDVYTLLFRLAVNLVFLTIIIRLLYYPKTKRKDYLLMLSHKQNPYFLKKNSKVKNKILEIPMPSISKFDLPIWHTIGFIFGFDYLVSKVKKYLEKNTFLNYVIQVQ